MSETPDPKPIHPETAPVPESLENQHKGALNTPTKAPLKKVGYFVRHWRGDLSLAQSFWVNMTLVNIGVRIISDSGASLQLTNLISAAAYVVLFWSIAAALSMWQFVGVWRAATKYDVPALSYIAKGIVMLFTLSSVIGLYRGVFPQVREAFRMVSGDSQIEDFKVTVLPSGKAVEFYGGLKLGSSKRLREVLDSAPYVTLIHLETLGGRLGEAIEMAKIVKERNLSTYVPNICASSGVVVFLAGKERTAKISAKIGFHRATFAGQDIKDVDDLFNKIFTDAGVRRDFITRVTSSVDMVYPSLAELIVENIVTKTTKGEGFSLGTHELAKNTIEKLRESLFSVETFLALSNVRPREFEALLQLGHQDLLQGVSPADIGRRHFRPLVLETTAPLWATASDLVMYLWLDCKLTLIRDNMDHCPADVVKILSGQEGSEMGKFKKYPIEQESHILAVLMSEKPVPFQPERKKRGEDTFTEVWNEILTPGEKQLLTAQDSTATSEQDLKKICEYMLRVYEAINKLPSDQKADVCKFLILPEE